MGKLVRYRFKPPAQSKNEERGVSHLLAQGHAAAQGARQTDDLGHKRLEGEVLLQHHASQDGLHLRDA